MICPNCKHDVDGSFEICSNCGAMLHQPVQAPPQQRPAAPQPAPAPQQPYRAPMPPQGQPQQMQAPQGYMPQPVSAYPQGQSAPAGKKKSKLAVIIPIVAVAVIAIIAAIVIAVSSHQSYDYTEIENDLKLYAPDFIGAEMVFRGDENGIHYVDKDFNPLCVYYFDKNTQKRDEGKYLSLNGYSSLTAALFNSGTYVFRYDDSYEVGTESEFICYDGDDKLTVEDNCREVCGSDVYITYKEDLYCNNDVIYTSSYEDDEYIVAVYRIKNDVFLLLREQDGCCTIKRVNSDKTADVILKGGIDSTSFNIYVDDSGFYYANGKDIKYYNVVSDEIRIITTVYGCDRVDYIYFACEERVYYSKWVSDSQVEIYYSEIDNGEAQLVYSGTCQIDEWIASILDERKLL